VSVSLSTPPSLSPSLSLSLSLSLAPPSPPLPLSQQATNLSTISYVFMLGGDSYDGDLTQRGQLPGLLDKRWGVGLKNDGETQ
jgi:hypothetical protein